MSDPSASAAELVARTSYGRLVAYLAARWGDVAAAEDALGDGFVAALVTWPTEGVPANPEAWLFAAARRRLIDAGRHRRVTSSHAADLRLACEGALPGPEEELFPDERLKLMFVCSHPAIDEAARTPLMLQTVLGLDAARIAAAFLVSVSAMSQRLVRVKAKIYVHKLFDVGFADLSYFNRAFRRQYNATPSDVRALSALP